MALRSLTYFDHNNHPPNKAETEIWHGQMSRLMRSYRTDLVSKLSKWSNISYGTGLVTVIHKETRYQDNESFIFDNLDITEIEVLNWEGKKSSYNSFFFTLYLNKIWKVMMRRVTWNLFPFKNVPIDSIAAPFWRLIACNSFMFIRIRKCAYIGELKC